MKHKAGDKVKIKESIYDQRAMNFLYSLSPIFVATIEKIVKINDIESGYRLEGDEEKWLWNDNHIEGLYKSLHKEKTCDPILSRFEILDL